MDGGSMRRSRWTVQSVAASALEHTQKGARTSHYNSSDTGDDDSFNNDSSLGRRGRRGSVESHLTGRSHKRGSQIRDGSPALDRFQRRSASLNCDCGSSAPPAASRLTTERWPSIDRVIEAAGDATESFKRSRRLSTTRRPSRSSGCPRQSSFSRQSQLGPSRISRYDLSGAPDAGMAEDDDDDKRTSSSCRRSLYACLDVGLDVCLSTWDCCLPAEARGTTGERALCDRLVIHPDNRGKRLFDALLVVCVVYVVAVVPVEVTWGVVPSHALDVFVDVVFIIDVRGATHTKRSLQTRA